MPTKQAARVYNVWDFYRCKDKPLWEIRHYTSSTEYTVRAYCPDEEDARFQTQCFRFSYDVQRFIDKQVNS